MIIVEPTPLTLFRLLHSPRPHFAWISGGTVTLSFNKIALARTRENMCCVLSSVTILYHSLVSHSLVSLSGVTVYC